MTANITDHFTEATNGTRPTPSVLSAIKAIGAASLSANALTGWTTNTAVHFILYNIDTNSNKIAGTQSDYKGIVSGSTITGILLKAGNDANYGIGTVIEAAPTAAWANDIADGILVEHLQSGTHGAITPTSVTSAGAGSFAGGVTDSGNALSQIRSDIIFDFVVSGGVVSLVSGLIGAFSNIVWYQNGVRLSKISIANNTYPINDDTYVDISPAGAVTYTSVANNAVSPAVTSGNVRIAIVITNGTTITQVNQGSELATAPIVSSATYTVVDGLGNMIYPRDPFRKILGFRTTSTSFVSSSTTAVPIPALSCPIVAPVGRKVKITVTSPLSSNNTAGNGTRTFIFDGTVPSGTQLNQNFNDNPTANFGINVAVLALTTPLVASKTYNAGFSVSAGTGQLQSNSVSPINMYVELY